MSDLSLLSRVKRKLNFGTVRSVFDPTRKLAEAGMLERQRPTRAVEKSKWRIPAGGLEGILDRVKVANSTAVAGRLTVA